MSAHTNSEEGGFDPLDLLRSLRKLLDLVGNLPDLTIENGFSKRLGAHLGHSPSDVPITNQAFPSYQLVDMQIAFEEWSRVKPGRSLDMVGLSGQHVRHFTYRDLLDPHQKFDVGPVEYMDIADSPTSTRSCVSFGALLLRDGATNWAVLMRGPDDRGNQNCVLEVATAGTSDAQSLLSELRSLAVTHSVLRGQIVALGPGEGQNYGGLRFMTRPQLSRTDLILPEDAIDRIEGHVIGVAKHHAQLAAAGQHLKRGVLLYGPPGTGKTHTVRYLLSQLEDRTAFVLSGQSLAMIGQACALARILSPSIVILEDIDLIAGDRSFTPVGTNSLLFEVLNQIDGLDGDIDVTFLLTTNRVDILERALSERPGRVDVAVEIAPPDDVGRRRLLDLYGSKLGVPQLTDEDVRPTIDLTRGRTATFMREVVRRASLIAVASSMGVELRVDGDVLFRAAQSLTDDRAELTRSIANGASEPDAEPPMGSPPGPGILARSGYFRHGSAGWARPAGPQTSQPFGSEE